MKLQITSAGRGVEADGHCTAHPTHSAAAFYTTKSRLNEKAADKGHKEGEKEVGAMPHSFPSFAELRRWGMDSKSRTAFFPGKIAWQRQIKTRYPNLGHSKLPNL